MADNTLEVRSAAVGSWQENCYVLYDAATNQSIVFDPGAEPKKIQTLIGDSTVTDILLTHAHSDHIGAVEAIRAATGAPVSIHRAELPALGSIHHDTLIDDGDEIQWGGHTIRAVHTPGHTPGMITFIVDNQHAIVGDTIFGGGPGRTGSAEDFRTTLATLRDVILSWPDTLVCYPGHGDSFRLADVRDRIQQFVAKEHPANFQGDAEW
ncbi:MAG TPA: MBL fold metallo-hydrolase [Herpetosiphonaceae bacterium]